MYNTDLPNRAVLPTSRKLFLSTLIAIVVAAILLVTVVLPSEYGIDPTKIGRVLGLTQMGETKMRLAEEASKNRASQTDATVATAPKPAAPVASTSPGSSSPKQDEMTVTLKHGEGVEVKMDMSRGSKVAYEWTASGGVINHDTHGDGANKAFVSYKKGTGVENDAGEFIAEFDGSHGWFWRNRTNAEVTVTIKARGDYQNFKKMA